MAALSVYTAPTNLPLCSSTIIMFADDEVSLSHVVKSDLATDAVSQFGLSRMKFGGSSIVGICNDEGCWTFPPVDAGSGREMDGALP